MTLGRRIEKRRLAKDKSRREMALAIECEVHVLRDLETGSIPKDIIDLLPKIAKYLGCSLYELLGIENRKDAPLNS